MHCPFCGNEISDRELHYPKCPYCNPEISNSDRSPKYQNTESALFSEYDEPSGDAAITDEKRSSTRTETLSHETVSISSSVAITDSSSKHPGQFHPEQFPGYGVKGEIGRGGFGSVLLAQEHATRRDIALKTFNPLHSKQSTSNIQTRFLDEALITAQLQHPGIIPIYTISQDSSGHYFYTMRPVEGEALNEILARLKAGESVTAEKYTLRSLIQILTSVCKTMSFAHDRGVIHRDLKPSNIIVGSYGEVLVIDWGLAKIIEKAAPFRDDENFEQRGPFAEVWASYQRELKTTRTDGGPDSQATREGHIMGTVSYMSPEQASGKIDELDHRSDMWSIGVILYECATLYLPFHSSRIEQILHRIIAEEPQPAFKANPHRRVPVELSEIVMRCLRKRKEERFASLNELVIELERWLAGIAPAKLIEEYSFSEFPNGPPVSLRITHGHWEVKDGILCGCDFGGLLTAQEIQGDMRIEVDAWVKEGEKGEISLLISAPNPEKSNFFYDGYVMRIISGDTTRTNIQKGNISVVHRTYGFSVHELQTIAAERIGTNVRLERNGQELLRYVDFFPLKGNRTGILSMGSGLRISAIRVYSMSSNLTLSCLDLAKSYHDNGMLDLANNYYTTIYHHHPDREEGVEALFRSGLLCLERFHLCDPLQDKEQMDFLLDTAAQAFKRVESSFYGPLGVLGIAMIYEIQEQYENEINELLRAYRDFPGYDTLPAITERLRIRGYVLEWETPLPSKELRLGIEKVLRAFGPDFANPCPLKGIPIDALELSEEVTDIAGLRGVELVAVNLSRTRIEDLNPLSEMPLKWLSLPPQIEEIEALENVPLEAIDLSLTSVHHFSSFRCSHLKYCDLPVGLKEIRPLKGQPLEYLDLSRTAVQNIDVISAMPLKVLHLPGDLESIPRLECPELQFLQIPDKIVEIKGLRDVPLRGIDLQHSVVSDISPLREMELEYINLSHRVSDISPLEGKKIRTLNLFHTRVTNLDVLRTMSHLKEISLYPPALPKGWEEIIGGLPELHLITTDDCFSPCSPSEFWHLYRNGELSKSRDDLIQLGLDRLTCCNSYGIEFRWVSSGVFLMGSPLHEIGREPAEKLHFVCINSGFYISTAPVRVCDFSAFVLDTGYRTSAEKAGWAYTSEKLRMVRRNGCSWRVPGIEQSADHPVVCVSWFDAIAYCQWLSRKEGRHYRLPTESEWEYCCRAGSRSPFHGDVDKVCWSVENSDFTTHPVKQKEKNKWGLYDMHGHVIEWCSDWYGPYPDGFAVAPAGAENGLGRVIRGGSWDNVPTLCRAASRDLCPPQNSYACIGFRVVLDLV